nr:MAG TPA: hypothetical protein [Caudoviricetes sp.]
MLNRSISTSLIIKFNIIKLNSTTKCVIWRFYSEVDKSITKAIKMSSRHTVAKIRGI